MPKVHYKPSDSCSRRDRQTFFGVVVALVLASLILIQPQKLQAAPLCSQIFSSKPSLKEMVSEFTQNEGQITTASWQSHLDAIQNPKEYIQFLKTLQGLSSLTFTSRYQYGAPPKGEDFLRNILIDLDFATPLLEMRSKISAPEKQQLLQEVKSLREGLTTTNTNTLEKWDLLLATFPMALDTRLAAQWLEHIPREQRLVFDRNDVLHKSTLAIFLKLPETEKAQVKSLLWGKLNKAFNEEKSARTETDADLAKTYRRNIETFHRILHQQELVHLVERLEKAPPHALVQEIDAFWSQIYKPHWKEKYSFATALEVARVLQKTPLLKTVAGASVEIYGSLTNGKASLATSDVDIHPGPILMTEYIEMMTDRLRDYSKPFAEERYGVFKRSREDILAFSKDLVESEKQVANVLGRSSYKAADLMTIVPSLNTHFFKPEIINYYNPISIHVTKDTITVIVHDVLAPGGTKTIRRLVR